MWYKSQSNLPNSWRSKKWDISVLQESFQFYILDDTLVQNVIWLLLLKDVFFKASYLSFHLRRNWVPALLKEHLMSLHCSHGKPQRCSMAFSVFDDLAANATYLYSFLFLPYMVCSLSLQYTNFNNNSVLIVSCHTIYSKTLTWFLCARNLGSLLQGFSS